MEEPNRLTDITLVIYPSNHVLKNSPKIALLGKGSHWKDEIVKHANNFWTETPVMFFYTDKESYDSDILSWLFLNIKNCDFIIGQLTEDIEDVSLIAPFASNEKTFLMYKNVKTDFRDWFETVNPNKEITTELPIVLKIKENWQVKCKYSNIKEEG